MSRDVLDWARTVEIGGWHLMTQRAVQREAVQRRVLVCLAATSDRQGRTDLSYRSISSLLTAPITWGDGLADLRIEEAQVARAVQDLVLAGLVVKLDGRPRPGWHQRGRRVNGYQLLFRERTELAAIPARLAGAVTSEQKPAVRHAG
jgi:hypothetical protein